MSDLRGNSVLGAVLAAALGVMGVGVAADAVYAPNYPEKAGYLPPVTEVGPNGPAAPAGPPDFGRLFADPAVLADLIARGERTAAACEACHTFEAGGAEGIGPNLHDVFGRAAATHGGFSFSEAMQGHDVTWDYLTLNSYLRSPAQDVRGTRMAFAGIRRDEDRVAVIAYLRSISPNNLPLPAPLPEAVLAEGAAPEGEGAATDAPPAAPAPH